MICGAGIGLGILLVIRGIFPRRIPLAIALNQLHGIEQVRAHRGGVHRGTVGHTSLDQPSIDQYGIHQYSAQQSNVVDEFAVDGLAARAGRPVARYLVNLPLLPTRVRADLAVLGRSPERHLAEKVTLGLFGLLLVPAFAGVLALGGTSIAWVVPLWAAVILAAGGFVLPDLGIHTEATKRRADFRHALGSFLDLVVIALAGGAGVEGALTEAAGIGSGWAFAPLRRALEEARLTRTPPWGPLGRLGDELGIHELSELAASVALAGAEGAKVRASLAAKATSIRSHALADAQANAEAMSERMSLPVVVLFAGFLLFVGYPALAHVLVGL
jgi:Flp pilus assembly protein TadB